MASCITTQWEGSAPQARLTVTLNTSKSDGDTAALDWKLEYVAHGYAASTSSARSYIVSIDDSRVTSGTYNINGVSSTKTIDSGTVYVSKYTSARSVPFIVSFAFNLTWSGTYKGTLTASSSLSIPAKTSYSVTYNANGGSGAPSKQTKWFGTTLTLSSTKPTRTGYDFKGWSTSNDTSVEYSPGAKYTANADLTLYAVWNAKKYLITFNANGGTGAPASQTKTYGVNLTLSGIKPTRDNYNFLGWATSASATKATYAAGAVFSANAATNLYAVWELAYRKPRVSKLQVGRYTHDESTDTYLQDQNGTYLYISFTYACDIDADYAYINVYDSEGTRVWYHSGLAMPTNMSGTYSTYLDTGGVLDADASYVVSVEVADFSGESGSTTKVLHGIAFVLDLLAGGKGISFGKPAEVEGYADFGYDIHVDQNKKIAGTDTEGNYKEAFNPQNENGNTVLGHGNYVSKFGNTNIYGYDVHIGVSNITNPGTYRPYRRQGDTLSIAIRTAGYVTNGGKDVSFFVPLAAPIVGSPTVTVSSVSGFCLRQGNTYTHGSSASATVSPSSYSASISMFFGVHITAAFTDTTNVTNNDAIGIYWSGTITFS